MATNYQNSQSEGSCEFYEDIQRVKYVKRLLSKYKDTGELKTRLMMNHLVILVNVFGAFPCMRILMYKIDSEYHSIIATFLNELKSLDLRVKDIMHIDNDIQNLIRADMK